MAERMDPASCFPGFSVSSSLVSLLVPFLLFSACARSSTNIAGTPQHKARILLTRRVDRHGPVPASPYAKALPLSIDFLEGQRSGRINGSGSVAWRANSGLKDGSDVKVRA